MQRMLVLIPLLFQISAESCPTGAVQIPDSDDHIAPAFLYKDCTSVTSASVDEGIQILGKDCFRSCSSLKSVSLPSTLLEIHPFCFSRCTSLTSISIPDSVTYLGRECFRLCPFTELVLPSSYERTDPDHFLLELPTLTHISFRKESPLYDIYKNQYLYTKGFETLCVTVNGVTTVSLHENTQSVGYAALGYCTEIKDSRVVFPDGVRTLGRFILVQCSTNVQEVQLGSQVMEIQDECFRAIKNLQRIIISAKNNHYETWNGMLFTHGLAKLLMFPTGRSDKYVLFPEQLVSFDMGCFADGLCKLEEFNVTEGSALRVDTGSLYSSDFTVLVKVPQRYPSQELRVRDGTKTIETGACYGAQTIKKVVLPKGMMQMGSSGFQRASLTSIDIPGSVSFIGPRQFYMSKLTSIVIPASVTTIEALAFRQSRLVSIQMGDNVELIDSHSLSRITTLQFITLPPKLTTIANMAFSESQLTSIVFPESLKVIGPKSFEYSSSLTELFIPAGVDIVDDGAFSFCSNIKSVTIENCCRTHVHVNAFSGSGSVHMTCILTMNFTPNLRIYPANGPCIYMLIAVYPCLYILSN